MTSLGSYTDVNSIDASTLAEARSIGGVDAFTGEPIEKAGPKKVAPPVQAKPEPKAATQVTTQTRATSKPLVGAPYEQTEVGYEALCLYWNENKKAPPDDFDLRRWHHTQLRKGTR